jgi:hypothetical protein
MYPSRSRARTCVSDDSVMRNMTTETHDLRVSILCVDVSLLYVSHVVVARRKDSRGGMVGGDVALMATRHVGGRGGGGVGRRRDPDAMAHGWVSHGRGGTIVDGWPGPGSSLKRNNFFLFLIPFQMNSNLF